MRQMLSIWFLGALLALFVGQQTMPEASSLSASGYHLCVGNESRQVSYLVTHQVPYTVTRPCGTWLRWKTCNLTLYKMTHQPKYKFITEQVTRCCDGYVQVGQYCALPVNRSLEFTAKPGSCPGDDVASACSEQCEWDIDCPGWQKCCQRSGTFVCTDPASFSDYSENGGYRFNVTVTVKTEFALLLSKERGLLNHTRLLHAMVTGALNSSVTVFYLGTRPVRPHRSATSLLIDSTTTHNTLLLLRDARSELHSLLKDVTEVTAVTVEDIDECAHPVLRKCSSQADCTNKEGSYVCECRYGYSDVLPSYSGAHCQVDGSTTTGGPPMSLGTASPTTTYLQASSTAYDPPRNITGLVNSSEITTNTSLSNASYVPSNSSNPPQWIWGAEPNATVLPSVTPACTPPRITSFHATNVTGTSFCVYLSGQPGHSEASQSYFVAVRQGSEVIRHMSTNQSMWMVTGLQPGVLYSVSVTPSACGIQGTVLTMNVKTVAQALDATTRITNLQFSDDLLNNSSHAYINLTHSIEQEILQCLSSEMRAMVDSGKVRIEITSLSAGSVVINFTIFLTPTESQDIRNVSSVLLSSLISSSVYTVDEESTKISDVDECSSGQNDCSQWATCVNSWGSYNCSCQDGLIDTNPDRPGRNCREIIRTTPPITTTTAPTSSTTNTVTTTTTLLTTTTTSISTTPPTTTDVSTATISTTTMAVPVTTTTTPTATTAVPTNTTTISTSTHIQTTASPTTTTTTSATPTTTTTPSTTAFSTIPTTMNVLKSTSAPTTIMTIAADTTSSTNPATNTTSGTANTNSTANAMILTNTAHASQTASTTTEARAIIVRRTAATTPAPTSASPASSTIPVNTNSTANSTILTNTTHALPTATTTTGIHAIIVPRTAATTPATTSAPPASSTVPVSTDMRSVPTITSTTTTIPTIPESISVDCRVAAITVSIAKDFLATNYISESALYLGLEECGVNGGNATHVQLTVAWDECNTTLVNNFTFYTASVELSNTMDLSVLPNGTTELPRLHLQLPIVCTYQRNMVVSADFESMGYETITDTIIGSGSFQMAMQLMNDTVPLPKNYTFAPDDDVLVEVSLRTPVEQLKVVINKCWATQSSDPKGGNGFIFLQNSCSPGKYTTVLENGNSSVSRISVQIFSIINHEVVYLHCHVQICVEIGSSTCVPDCTGKRSQMGKMLAYKRIMTGPVRKGDDDTGSLQDTLDTIHVVGFSCLGVGLTLILLFVFLTVFYCHRNRIGHYNFNNKPKDEKFIYFTSM